MSTHTTGGWDWKYKKGNHEYLIYAPLRAVAWFHATRDEATDVANAKLIAAAPKLLEVCKSLVDLVEVLIRHPYPEDACNTKRLATKEAETFEVVVKTKEIIAKIS